MCAEFLLAFLLLQPLSHRLQAGACPEISVLDVPEELIDAEIDSDGSVYILMPGVPRLLIYSMDGSVRKYDLSVISLPGGLSLDGRRGWYVSDAVAGKVFRFGACGEAMESFDAPGRPGDIALFRFSLVYVSRERGAVSGIDAPDALIFRLEGAGEGQLSASGEALIYSDGAESYLYKNLDARVELPSSGIWALLAGDPVVHVGDSLVLFDGSVVHLPGSGNFSRISCAPDGSGLLLWAPGRGEALVLR